MNTSQPIIEHELLPREMDRGLSSSENSWRVKLFWQNAEGAWDEGGTGQCQIVPGLTALPAPQKETYFIVVHSEPGSDCDSGELLHSEITLATLYRQQKGLSRASSS
jgi:hypothetical protein